MKRKMTVVTTVLVLLQLCSNLRAITTTSYEAEQVVKGWLKLDPKPLGAALGQNVTQVETFTDENNEPIYYNVYLEPSGFVIVSADDLIEPIIGFSEKGSYSSSSSNPFGAFVTKALKGRIAAIRNRVGLLTVNQQPAVTNAQMKWNLFLSLAEATDSEAGLMAVEPKIVTDVRVAPLISATWGQEDACGYNCFNMYTPNNYPCGCIATMIAQVMRLHQYPTEPNDYDPNEADKKCKFSIEWFDTHSLSIITEDMLLRGGDGNGGPYQWDKMPNVPSCNSTLTERQAIGAVCYDAGIASNMFYSEWGSGTYMADAKRALIDVFDYSNAIEGGYDPNEIKQIPNETLEKMVNPNLDAGNPVFLGIDDAEELMERHAVLCDGYGFDTSTMYHHLNFGWIGMPTWAREMWFLLPDITYGASYDYDIISSCVYNIFTTEKGEIISGRLFDNQGNLVEGASVTAQIKGGKPNTAVTTVSNRKGMYALKGLNSNTTYIITVEKTGYDFEPAEAATGKSEDSSVVCGNIWGFDLEGHSNIVQIGSGTKTWNLPLYASSEDVRTQVIYLASEIGTAGKIIALSLEVTKPPEQVLENWTIRIKHTDLNEYTGNTAPLQTAGWTVVYQNNESIDDQGWHSFEFQTPFEYNGTDNLLVDFSFNNSSSTSYGLCRISTPGGRRSAYSSSDSAIGDPLDWQQDALTRNNVPNIQLTFSE